MPCGDKKVCTNEKCRFYRRIVKSIMLHGSEAGEVRKAEVVGGTDG